MATRVSPGITATLFPQEQASLFLPRLLHFPESPPLSLPASGGGDRSQSAPLSRDRSDLSWSNLDPLLGYGSDHTTPLVGILDNGFDLTSDQIDLANLGNGPIYLGYDWVEGDRNPLVSEPASHGSQVLAAFGQTATSTATTNLWLGRAVGSGDWAASLVEFVATAQALDHPNAVVNLSFELTERQGDGSITPRTALTPNELAALEFARQQGVIVVAAAGNDNASLSALALASLQFDNVITVGAADKTATLQGTEAHRARYSNHGEGLSLLAEVPESFSGTSQGTSLAAVQVTQAVQSLWQQNATLSHRQVIDLLQSSAIDLQAPGWDSETGHGLLNLDQALRAASQMEASAELASIVTARAASLDPWDFRINNPQYRERVLALDVGQVTPRNGSTNIDTQASIRVQFASEAIDPATLTSDSFQLLDSNGTAIAASIGTDITGGVISLTPQGPLDPFSTYSVVITADLLNTQGEAATPFSTRFTTGAQGSSPAGLRFDNQPAQSGESRFGISSIAVGPDGNVYASDILGNVLRYNLDPSTGLATSTDSVFAQSGAQIVGITFDPNATATDLQLWITYAERDNTGFSGTISKLALPAVAGGTTIKQDYITGLPNSIGLAHQPNGITFGPDGKLYQTVGGVATLGGTPNWGVDESLLSAAVIVADVNSASFPTNQTGNAVDVQTVGLELDGDPTTNNYDPFAPNAPVQILATGLRNAYDLVWHSNGNLYSGINQNSIGGAVRTPASPDGSVPAINARPNEMLALIREGNYYGHPNPSRGEYILNGGNPTAGIDPREVTAYPVGIEPDPNFDPSLIFDTRSVGGTSPNGLTEYTGSGLLNGRLLVSFFNGARTIQSFELGADGLVSATAALQDASGNNLQLLSPLDVAVHPSGRIYVASFGFGQNNPNGSTVRVLTPIATPGVIITPSSGSTEVTEGGNTDSYSVVLATQPSGPVTLGINPDGQLSSDAPSLSFTPTNWNVPQMVTVSAIDDSETEGNHSGRISHSITSGSGDYGTGLAIASITASITDNDNQPLGPGVEIIETNGRTAVTEGGNSDSLSIRLTAEPTDNVILTLMPDGQLDLGLGESGFLDLTFTPANWNQAQSITVDAVDDAIVEGSHSGTLRYNLDSADAAYESLAIAPTSVSITDNDAPPLPAGLILQPSGPGTTVAESGSTDSYQVSLASQPITEVTVNLALDSQLSLANGQSPSLSFTPSNWDTPQTVVLGAVDDSLVEGNHSGSVTHSITSSDSNYAALVDEILTAAVLDNDQASVVLTPSGGSTDITEGGNSDGYSIALSSQPSTNVVITIAFDSAQVSLSSPTLTFTPSNWDSPQVVQVTAIDDSDREGNQVLNLSHTASSSDGNYDGLAIASLTVNLFDNDGGGMALFVAGSTNLSGSDIQARTILEDLGFEITVVDDGASTTGDAQGKDLVVISQSVSSNRVGSKFTNVDVPIVVWESFLYDDLGMANDFGFIRSGGTSLTFINDSHPLAADLALGNQTIYNNAGELGWGNPTSSDAIRIAHTGNPSHLGIFGYEAGAAMDVGSAPARRVAVNLWETPNSNGAELFRAAVQWATGQDRPQLPPQPGTLSFANTTFSYGEAGNAINAITIERSEGDAGAVTAEVSISYRPVGNGNASAPDLVTSASVTVTFADGDSNAKVISLEFVDDLIEEGNEIFDVSLAVLSGGANLDPAAATATVNILDNDAVGTIEFVSGSYSIGEAGGTAAISLTRTGGSAGAQTITVIPTDGTATSGADYGAVPASVTFADGEAGTKQVLIPIVNDNFAEANETIDLQLTGTAVGPQTQATLTILDNDTAVVVVTPSNGSTAISEAGLSDSYQLALSSQPTRNVTLTIDFDSSQVNLSRSTLTFTPANWNTPQTVTVDAVDDGEIEGSQTLNLNHIAVSADPSYNGIPIANLSVTITDNDGGGKALFVAGSTNLGVADQAARAILEDLGYEITVVDDGASRTSDASGQDLIVISQSVFSGQVNTKFTDVAVPLITWESFLYDELGLSNRVGYANGQSSITLTNNSHPLAGNLPTGVTQIYSGNNTVAWGAPTSNSVINIAHTGDPIQLAIFGYEAGSSMDVGTAAARRVAANFWNTPDATGNGEALFIAAVQWATGQSQPPTPQPGRLAFSATSFSYDEADNAINAITVERSGGNDGAVSANINLSYRPAGPGVASAADVVTSSPITVIFADGDSRAKVISLDLFDDSIEEGNEVFDVNLAIATGQATLDPTQASATVNIIDNDAAGTIEFASSSYAIGEAGGAAAIALTRTGGSAGAQAVTVMPTDGTATSGADYGAVPVSITFADGEAGTKLVAIPIVDDRITELSETVALQLSGAALGQQTQATLTIEDNDSPGVAVSPSGGSTTVSEDGLSDSYQLALSSQPIGNVTVAIGFDDEQLSLDKASLSFTPANWDIPQVVTVTALDDGDVEGSQTFSLTHIVTSSDSNYSGISIANLSVTVADNDQPLGGNALFVAGATELSGSDVDARNLLISKGYSVTVVDDDRSRSSDANGQDLVLISQTVQSTKVSTQFTNAAVPIIVWESFLYDDLGMSNGFGFIRNRSNITLTNSSHPLSGGLPLGNTPIYSGSGEIGWGDPTNNNAISIAHTGNPNQLTVFGYEAGVTMDGLVAPAKRVGVSFWENPDNQGNNEALLEAAIDWARS